MNDDEFDNCNDEVDNSADKTAKEIILDVKRILDKHDIHFFPLFGTVLGFIRDKGVIEHDNDADLGTWYTNQEKILSLKDEFLANGYVMGGSGLKYKYRYLSLTPINNRFKVDIAFLIKDVDCCVFSIFPDNNFLERMMKKHDLVNNRILLWANRRLRTFLWNRRIRWVYPVEWFEEQIQHTIYNTTFYLPKDAIGYLTSTYGDNWQTKDKEWNRKNLNEQGKKIGMLKKYKIKGNELKNILYYREVK